MIRRAKEKDLPRVNTLLKQVLTVHADGRPENFRNLSFCKQEQRGFCRGGQISGLVVKYLLN